MSYFIGDLGANSESSAELLLALEEEFELDIPDSVVYQLLSVADVVRFIERRTLTDGGDRNEDGLP